MYSLRKGLGIYKAHGNEGIRELIISRQGEEWTKAQNSEGTRYAEGDESPSVWQDYNEQTKDNSGEAGRG